MLLTGHDKSDKHSEHILGGGVLLREVRFELKCSGPIMNCKYKFAVDEELKNIKECITANNVVDSLYEKGIVSRELCREIREASESDGNDMFYDYFLKCEHRYQQFVEVILKTYAAWIYIKIHQRLVDETWIQDIFKSVLNFGDFPRKPNHYVKRKDKISQVQNVLQKLPIDGKIVLYGMAGSGKSNLVIGVMSPDLVLDIFGGKVYWVNVGDVNCDQILRLMSRLHMKINENDSLENFTSIDVLKIKLQQKIREKGIDKHMLIILDNVYDRAVIDAFDIGCKIMITTQNKSILSNDASVNLIEIDGTFKIEETYELFASCLGVSVDQIRKISEAKEIHRLCKGHPLSIALFGSQIITYRESLLRDKTWWTQFVLMLKRGTYHEQDSAIKSCIDSLDENLRGKYQDFAIFPEDVNIATQVLETLWDINKYEVNDIMTQLENKSLVVSYYNHYDNSYNYGIHVVLLKYLKSTHKTDIHLRHQKLIDNYSRKCDDDYSKLPDDNYIFQYIGYHLKKSGYVDRFNIYFNLNFIDAKIKAAGVGDVLRDLDLYEQHILMDTLHKNLLNELKAFISNFGRHLHERNELNLVQSALKYSKDNNLKKLALETAAANKSALYFDMECFPGDCKCVVNDYRLPESCTCVCFGLNQTELLCGTKEGDIVLIDLTDQKIIRTFKSHLAHINYLELSSEGDRFLSVSDDRTASVWRLEDDLNKSEPSIKQKHYNNFYKEDHSIRPQQVFVFETSIITAATFANKSNLILTATDDGTIRIWNDDVIQREIKCDVSVKHLKFLLDDDLIVGCDEHELVIYDVKGLEVWRSVTEDPISSIIVVDEDSFVTIYSQTVSLWGAVSKRMPGERVPGVREDVICTLERAVFLAGFVDHLKMNLYVISDDNKTRMFDIKTKALKGTSSDQDTAVAVDIYLYSETNTIFLYKYVDNYIKIHNTSSIMQNVTKRTPIFDCYWSKDDPTVPRTVSVIGRNSLEIMSNGQPSKDIETKFEVNAVCFSPCGNKIAYGLESGEVMEYDIRSARIHCIMRLFSPVTYLKFFNRGSSESGILVAGGDKGDLMIRCSEKNLPLITTSKVSSFHFEPVVETFYLGDIGVLLTIMKDRVIKCWNLTLGGMDVMKGRKSNALQSYIVTAATMNYDKKLLAITMTNMFDIFIINTTSDRITINDLSGRLVNTRLYCCCFNYDGKYIAFGGEDGNIMVYYINLEKQVLVEYTTLRLHTSPVRYIMSSPVTPLVFVSVGEQIAWWNLLNLTENNFNRNRRSFRKSTHQDLLSDIRNLSLSENVMNKVGDSLDKPHLLRTIKLKGSYANYMSASSTFTNFVTLDDEGTNYHMKMLNNETQ